MKQLVTSISTLTKQLENADEDLKQQFMDFLNVSSETIIYLPFRLISRPNQNRTEFSPFFISASGALNNISTFKQYVCMYLIIYVTLKQCVYFSYNNYINVYTDISPQQSGFVLGLRLTTTARYVRIYIWQDRTNYDLILSCVILYIV